MTFSYRPFFLGGEGGGSELEVLPPCVYAMNPFVGACTSDLVRFYDCMNLNSKDFSKCSDIYDNLHACMNKATAFGAFRNPPWDFPPFLVN